MKGTRSGRALAPSAVMALLLVAHHRLLSTRQITVLRGEGTSRRWTLSVLADLEARGLVGRIAQRGQRKLWHATDQGIELARHTGALADTGKALSSEDAAGALQQHTLAVNQTGIAFLKAARERGDDFGPFSWRHEIAHPLNVSGRRTLISDALLTYLHTGQKGDSYEYRLLELDRATLTVDRLARKLARYARLHRATDNHHRPRWRAWYPTFPAVHVVLANDTRAALQRRRDAVVAVCRANPYLADAPGPAISICLLEDLDRDGPFSPIFQPLADDRPVDWLGQTARQSNRTEAPR